jgi:aminoglycoside phosphotransferase (APT) family kinase protein
MRVVSAAVESQDTPDALAALARKIESWLGDKTGGAVAVRELKPLPGGACQDNYRIDLNLTAGEVAGDRRMVLRSDARRSLPASLNRREEFEVIQAALAAGVKTPAVRWLTQGLVREGAFAYFMDWVDGEAIGRRVVRNSELAEARQRLPEQLAEALSKVHSVNPANAPNLRFSNLASPDAAPAPAAIESIRRQIDGLPEPHPALELALEWLIENAPASFERTLVHADFRIGNFMVSPRGLGAVLDWEFAHWGDPFEDLGWLCVRDWRFGQLAKPVGGIARRDIFYAAYQRASGRSVDPKRVHYWEVAGNVRWATASIYQGERYLSGEESDIELLGVARRAVEMEFEALRLIEQGV